MEATKETYSVRFGRAARYLGYVRCHEINPGALTEDGEPCAEWINHGQEHSPDFCHYCDSQQIGHGEESCPGHPDGWIDRTAADMESAEASLTLLDLSREVAGDGEVRWFVPALQAWRPTLEAARAMGVR